MNHVNLDPKIGRSKYYLLAMTTLGNTALPDVWNLVCAEDLILFIRSPNPNIETDHKVI